MHCTRVHGSLLHICWEPSPRGCFWALTFADTVSTKQVYTLNTETWKWTEHTSEIEGEAPSPRYGHAAVALPDGRHLATFGGCDQADHMFFSSIALLDTLTWRWTTPKIQASL